jgi:hypothetical protein
MPNGCLIPCSGYSETSAYPEAHGFTTRSTILFTEYTFYIILPSALISSKQPLSSVPLYSPPCRYHSCPDHSTNLNTQIIFGKGYHSHFSIYPGPSFFPQIWPKCPIQHSVLENHQPLCPAIRNTKFHTRLKYRV